MTAAGQPYNEETAKRLARYDAVTLVCGHYEGIDQRVIDAFGDEEISIGDYVLTGGELASLVVADSVDCGGHETAFWPRKKATRMKVTGTACWNTLSIPGPKCGRAAPYRRCS